MSKTHTHKANNALGSAIILCMAIAATFEVGESAQVEASKFIRYGLVVGIVISVSLYLWYRHKANTEKN